MGNIRQLKAFFEKIAPIGTRIRILEINDSDDGTNVDSYSRYIGTMGTITKHLGTEMDVKMDRDGETFFLYVSTDKWEIVKEE